MKVLRSKILPLATLTLAAAAVPVHATIIPVTYSLSGTANVVGSTATALTLQTAAIGSLLTGDPTINASWNPLSYTELCLVDLTTNVLTGNFTISLEDGDTLVGTDWEDQTVVDESSAGTGPFPQILTITGGTGAFADATGLLTGEGFVGTTDFTVSGSGSVNLSSAPEPTPLALFLSGVAFLVVGRWRRTPGNASKLP